MRPLRVSAERLLAGQLDELREHGQAPAVGLDLSLTCTGWAVRWPDRRLEHGVWPTRPDPGVFGAGLAARLREVASNASVLAARAVRDGPALLVIERPFGAAHGNDGLLVYGAVLARLAALEPDGLLIVPASPATLKKLATGSGAAAGKTPVALAARDRLGWDGADDNSADACWAAELAAHLLHRPTTVLPAAHRAAVDTILRAGTPAPRRKTAA